MKKAKPKKAQVVISMPDLVHLGRGHYWFFLPVPFMYDNFPFNKGERLLVTVEKAK